MLRQSWIWRAELDLREEPLLPGIVLRLRSHLTDDPKKRYCLPPGIIYTSLSICTFLP
jgi:hypothetical protein